MYQEIIAAGIKYDFNHTVRLNRYILKNKNEKKGAAHFKHSVHSVTQHTAGMTSTIEMSHPERTVTPAPEPGSFSKNN